LSIPMLSQGVPFFHAGDDILRSKSLDGNSYDSGDWFNAIDWSYATNNWGIGLPIEGTNNWGIYQPLLANTTLKPQSADIMNASAVFDEFLQIRKSSPLFRLQTADQVIHALTFLNNGPSAMPGLIVMRLQDVGGLDAKYSEILVLVNANTKTIQFSDPTLKGFAYTLHPVQQNSADLTLREVKFESTSDTFTIPALTTAVFVVEKPQLSQPIRIVLGALVVLLLGGLVYVLTSSLRRKRQMGK
jgi:pullulanase